MTDKQHVDGDESGPTTEDEPIVYTSHHRELIRQAGQLAKAEQERLEKQLRLRNGRTPG
jgi:hypothetical protein